MQTDAIAQLITGLAEGNAALEALLSQALTRALGKAPEVPDMDALRHIRDWLKGALASQSGWLRDKNRDGVPVRLARIASVDAAYKAADKDMKRAANSLKSRFADAASAFEKDEAAGHFKTVHVFDDGSRMVQLLTPYALDSETAQLGHCIGNGGYDDNLGKAGHAHYSYRDALNRAHATLEVVDGVLEQCKGKENAPPVERYFKPIQDFIRQNKWKLTEYASHTGLLEKDGVYYEVANLPDGFTWGGSVLLEDCKWLKHLPDNLQVGGSLDLSSCKGLTALPDNLQVGWSLSLSGCTGLTALPDNLWVGRNLSLCGCTGLITLPANLHVGRELNLYRCTGLTALPDNLHVGESVNLEGCTGLTALPNNLRVADYLGLMGCTGLTALPDNLHVGGNLMLNGCTNLKRLPKKMMVKGIIHWNDRKYTSVADFRRAFEAKYPPVNDNARAAVRRKAAGMRPA